MPHEKRTKTLKKKGSNIVTDSVVSKKGPHQKNLLKKVSDKEVKNYWNKEMSTVKTRIE